MLMGGEVHSVRSAANNPLGIFDIDQVLSDCQVQYIRTYDVSSISAYVWDNLIQTTDFGLCFVLVQLSFGLNGRYTRT